MTTRADRSDFERLVGITPKLIRFFESQFADSQTTSKTVGEGVEATRAIQSATVLTLSSNEAFTNERVVIFDAGSFQLTDTGAGGTLTIQLSSPITTNGGYQCIFNLQADTNITLPTDGTIPSSSVGPYADDAAAAAAGVQIGEWYAKTGGSVVWRQA